MKKYNLAALGFAAFTIYNNATMTHMVDGKEIPLIPNDKGLVQLVASDNTAIGKKNIKAGETHAIKIADVMKWVEAGDWVEVPVSDDQKSDLKKQRKELENDLKDKTAKMLEAFGKPEFNEIAASVNAANTALKSFDEANPSLTKGGTRQGSGRKTKTYTAEEQAGIDAYIASVTAAEDAKKAMLEAKAGLPSGYKTKGTRGVSEGPKINDEIRAAMMYEYENGTKVAHIADKYGYSSTYVGVNVKGGGKTGATYLAKTKEAYEKIGKDEAKKFSESFKLA